ncbi:MAG: efflux RND transporter periplasmic adaptor subunit [Bacillota bacterium]
MKKKVKWILWFLLILAVVAYSLFAYLQPLAAPLLEVRPQAVEKSFTESGTVISALEQDLFSLAGGKILALHTRQGAEVRAGDLLVAMDTQELKFQLDQLEGQLLSTQGQESIALRNPSPAHAEQQRLAIRQAEMLVERAQTDYAHLTELHEAGAVSRKTLEEGENALFEAENLLARQKLALDLLHEQLTPPPGTREQFAGLRESLQAQKALLEHQINQSSVFAPFDGIIKDVFVKEGAVTLPGTPLLSIFQPGNYQVEVFLLTGDMEQVQPGMPVSITYAGSIRDYHFEGKVYAVAPTAVETVSALGLVEQRVKVTVAPAGNIEILRPGYEVDVKFVTHREEEKLSVPRTAVFTDNGTDALWVVQQGRAEIRQVKKGLETDEKVVIEEGLHSGDQIIRNPRLAGLAEGKRVVGQIGRH